MSSIQLKWLIIVMFLSSTFLEVTGKNFSKFLNMKIDCSDVRTGSWSNVGFLEMKRIEITYNNISVLERRFSMNCPPWKFWICLGIKYRNWIHVFFRDCNLKILNLSDNKLTRFQADYLPFPNKIENFILSQNLIEYFDVRAKKYVKNAEIIDMEENKCISKKFDRSQDDNLTLTILFGLIDEHCDNELWI